MSIGAFFVWAALLVCLCGARGQQPVYALRNWAPTPSGFQGTLELTSGKRVVVYVVLLKGLESGRV